LDAMEDQIYNGYETEGLHILRKCKSKRKDYRIFKTRHSVALLNIFPYNNGHLKNSEVLDLFRAIDKVRPLLDKVLKPDGYNIRIC
jgi:diadenosine tetraphosphate (Ap4A) HIT family hydrolase